MKNHALWTALWLVTLTVGCSENLPHGDGRVQTGAGITVSLEGDALELRSVHNPTQLAYAQIGRDGHFTVECLIAGEVVPGAPPGQYQARLVIADDDYVHKARALKEIPKRYFSFDTSNLIVELPSKSLELNIAQ